MSTVDNYSQDPSNSFQTRMASTTPMIPRHIFPMMYPDMYVLAEMGRPIRDLEENLLRWKPVLLYLVLSILFLIIVHASITGSFQSSETLNNPQNKPHQISAAELAHPQSPSLERANQAADMDKTSPQPGCARCKSDGCMNICCAFGRYSQVRMGLPMTHCIWFGWALV